MIYQFRSKAGPDVIMLTDLTKRIFDAMGCTLENRGIFVPEKLSGLISKLESAISHDLNEIQKLKKLPQIPTQDQENSSDPKMDRLGQRAFPFLTLMKQAEAAQEPIVWGV